MAPFVGSTDVITVGTMPVDSWAGGADECIERAPDERHCDYHRTERRIPRKYASAASDVIRGASCRVVGRSRSFIAPK